MGEASYGKRPMWQWIIIYLVIAIVAYGLIYYFVLAKKGGINYGTSQQNTSQPTMSSMPSQSPAASSKSTMNQTGNSVTIASFAFSPASLTVKVGDTVTWTNQDSIGHSATANDGTFDTGILDQGKSGSFTFTKAGRYEYHCSVHPNMHGTIIVQ